MVPATVSSDNSFIIIRCSQQTWGYLYDSNFKISALRNSSVFYKYSCFISSLCLCWKSQNERITQNYSQTPVEGFHYILNTAELGAYLGLTLSRTGPQTPSLQSKCKGKKCDGLMYEQNLISVWGWIYTGMNWEIFNFLFRHSSFEYSNRNFTNLLRFIAQKICKKFNISKFLWFSGI